ncbi:TetR/AcrR family transcriptional regulator [Staphylococcus schleiferi]|uniref:TetR/AcrR family transcriptional regulator n=1 Tax=Staphylococcus schleiferi TaxID=1295 RepID=UPI0014319CBD|nr:TetR family transcriptional regulator [Staphylococcus schleiferi]NHA41178.1 TetR/AcrR family transcriptional regulator [Staphylococcus schleiferi]
MDRRVRKTKTAIKNAMITLLKTEKLDKITVNQIADVADINRATFYQHYLDKYDLLDQIEQEMIEQMQINFNEKIMRLKAVENAEEAAIVFKEIPRAVLTIMHDDLDRYRVLLTMGRNYEIEQKIGEMIELNLKSLLLNDKEIAGIPFRYFHAFVLGSMWSLMRTWVLDEARSTIDEQVENIYKLMYQGPWRIIYEVYH